MIEAYAGKPDRMTCKCRLFPKFQYQLVDILYGSVCLSVRDDQVKQVKAKKVIIEILPGHVDVIVYEGLNCTGLIRLPITEELNESSWPETLRQCHESFHPAFRKMKLSGSHAHVLYRSETQSVGLESFHVYSIAQAVEAGILNCQETLPYSPASAICQGMVVNRDSGGDCPQKHVVVAADQESLSNQIADMVDQSGIKLASITPLDALVLANLVNHAFRDKRTHQSWLYIGRYSSFFLITSAGVLLFCRQLFFGVESMAGSLQRLAHTIQSPQPVNLDMDGARRIIQEWGIPSPYAQVNDSPVLCGSQVIPLLQPVLQRFITELRQSLRFSVSESDRYDLSIQLIGPGSALPGMAELIDKQLGIRTITDSDHSEYDWTMPGSEARKLLSERSSIRVLDRVNLISHDRVERRETNRIRSAIWCGATVALLFSFLCYFYYTRQINQMRPQVSAIADHTDHFAVLKATDEKLREASGQLGELELLIEKELGNQVNYRGCMLEISRLTPETIKLTTVSFNRLQDETIGKITGYVFPGEGNTNITDLDPYVKVLRDSPLLKSVTLGNVYMDHAGNRECQQFDIHFIAVQIPVSRLSGQADSSSAVGTGGEF